MPHSPRVRRPLVSLQVVCILVGMFGLIWDWYSELPWYFRYGVGLLLIAISTLLLLAGRIWIWGWVVGAAMLLFASRTQAEKNGYRNY
jgi:hypothetical protein